MAGMETAGLAIGLVSLGGQIPHLMRVMPIHLEQFKSARSDIDAVTRELASLNLCVQTITREYHTYSDDIQVELAEAAIMCELCIKHIEEFLKQFMGLKRGVRLKYTMKEKDKMKDFRSDLEACKSHLSIAIAKASFKTVSETKRSSTAIALQTQEIHTTVNSIDGRMGTMAQDIGDLRSFIKDFRSELKIMNQHNETQAAHQAQQLQSLIDAASAQMSLQELTMLFEDEGIDLSAEPDLPYGGASNDGSRPIPDPHHVNTSRIATSETDRRYEDRIAQLEARLRKAQAANEDLAVKIAAQEYESGRSAREKQELLSKIYYLEYAPRINTAAAPTMVTMPFSPPDSPEVLTKEPLRTSTLDTRSLMSARIESPDEMRYDESSQRAHYNDYEDTSTAASTTPPQSSKISYQIDPSDRRTASEPTPAPPLPQRRDRTRSVPQTSGKSIPLVEFTVFDEHKGSRKMHPPETFYTVRLHAWASENAGPWTTDNEFIPEDQLEAYMDLLRHKEEASIDVFKAGTPFVTIKSSIAKLFKTETYYPEELFEGKSLLLQHESKILQDTFTISQENLQHGDRIWLVLRDARVPLQDLVLEDLAATGAGLYRKPFRVRPWTCPPEAMVDAWGPG